jgi:hypothetical protein
MSNTQKHITAAVDCYNEVINTLHKQDPDQIFEQFVAWAVLLDKYRKELSGTDKIEFEAIVDGIKAAIADPRNRIRLVP